MVRETKEFFEKFENHLAEMKELIPDAVHGFSGMFQRVMKDGALTNKEKELIALSIGVTQRCAPCIRLHVQKSLAAGATEQEILEAASVAVMMGGGPAYTHIPIVMNALKALRS